MITIMTNTKAANPSIAGTKAIIHVGAATQLDSTSQKTVPRNDLQHPPLQKLGSEQLELIIQIIIMFSII
jgi:hypothetical protein